MSLKAINTIGYEVADNYLQALYTLDADRFCKLLSPNVEMVHITNDQEYAAVGREKVTAIYREKFFNVTSDFDIRSGCITSNGLQPNLDCEVVETKKEEGNVYRAKFIDRTTLQILQEEGEWKISKITSKVTKEILPLKVYI